MGFLQSLFGASKKSADHLGPTEYYLAGWEVKFDGKDHCESFIETQITTKEIAENMYSHIRLKVDSAGVVEEAEKKDHDGNAQEMTISNNIVLKNYRLNTIINFQVDAKGLNYLGGKTSSGFLIPENNCPGSFQFLGMISKKSLGFDWLPFDVNLICPIYMDMDKVWLDYANPAAPQIINRDEVNSLSTAYDDLKPDSFIEYQQVNFTTSEGRAIAHEIGFSGIPQWIQYPAIPRCPKTNRTMRFLCQLQSSGVVRTSRTNVVAKDNWYKQYFEKMNFWSDGDLFVFFDPESKVACYMIQNT